MTAESRYVGSPLESTGGGDLTGVVPAHLPDRLTVCLWDFSWYTRAGVGEPYENLDRVMRDTAARGYNTVRICAAPLLLFGDLALDALAEDLEIEGLGRAAAYGNFGQRTRWYNVAGGYRIDLRARLFQLFDAAERHGIVVILSSWEYQQSPSFARSSQWFEAINSVPLAERIEALGRAWDHMLVALANAGHTARVAFVEIHNEVDFSILPPLPAGGSAVVSALRARHPGLIITASYGKPPHLAMFLAPDGLGAAQFHVYSYGVLDALQKQLDIRSEDSDEFPNPALRRMLLRDAPSATAYGRPAEWKLKATVVTEQMLYGYDWIDHHIWDAWLRDHYPPYRGAMLREIESRVIAIAAWARWKEIPAVIGEGWVGYTPLRGSFEEGADGLELAEHGIRTALGHGIWGMVLCSNAAPHHPMWANVGWQRRMNDEILGHRVLAEESVT